MRDAPDQSAYPLTRRAVERLLNTYERRDEETSENQEARSIEGMRKARWYPPEQASDFTVDDPSKPNLDDRPAKLMPYDYYFSVHKPGDRETEYGNEISDADTDVDPDEKDWKGASNTFFKEEEDRDSKEANGDDIHQTLMHSIKNAEPVELKLADGNFIHLTPHDTAHLLKHNDAYGIAHAMASVDHFKEFVKQSFGKITPPAEHKPHY
jgi:hypothetical protein